MKTNYRLLACVLIPLLGGCASTTSRLDLRFGESLSVLQAQQTADLSAPTRNRDRMVLGFEARTASLTMDRYYQSYTRPPKPVNIFSIGFGQRSAP